MKIYAEDMFFRGNTDKEKAHDYCIHGKVNFNIDGDGLCDDSEWCVSASAYRFLHTVFENHFTGSEDFLIPCCGHFMIPSEDKQTVIISGCTNGIDFDIIHERANIIIKSSDKEYTVAFDNYKSAVMAFAKQIEDFYKASPPKEFDNDFDRNGFNAFCAEWNSLCDKAKALDFFPETTPISFDNFDVITDDEITYINEIGIYHNRFGLIKFKECAYNFEKTHGAPKNCVGECDTDSLSINFYNSFRPISIKFTDKKTKPTWFKKLKKETAISRFQKLQKQIMEYGYITRNIP